MKIDSDLLRRFKLFGTGLFMGILLLLFFFSGKRSKCTWFPNERGLQFIRSKHIQYSKGLEEQLLTKVIDSNAVNTMLLNGDIDFSKSEPRQKPCKKYWIDGKVSDKEAVLHVTICDSIATLSPLNFN